ncbi:SDR family oxidoreductase [Jiella pacifica]|uniref:SDR family oxidoreductase n=1 Tax=Jiella pacifica TaxID=2696469 RepID=UPI0019402E8D
MKTRSSGTVVNIIGDLGRSPRFDYVCGSTANAALIAFTEAVGAKSTDWNERVFGVNPSGTKIDRVVQVARKRAESALGDPERWPEILSNLPFGRLAEPDEIARMVVMLASPLAGYLSGTVVDIDAGLRHRK